MFVSRVKPDEAQFLSNLGTLPNTFIEHLPNMLHRRNQRPGGDRLPVFDLLRHACEPIGKSLAGFSSGGPSGPVVPSVPPRSCAPFRLHLAYRSEEHTSELQSPMYL